MSLPPGRLIHSSEVEDWPALWLSDEPAPAGLWSRLRAAHRESGLWPLLLEGLSGDESRPWEAGELWPHTMSDPATHDADVVLAQMWSDGVPDPQEADATEHLAPSGATWPGRAAPPPMVGRPDEAADECADVLVDFAPGAWLGLVAAERGSDAIAVAGWTGPANHTVDTRRLAAVLRDWEDRFGVRVIQVGFDTLTLSVAAPPRTQDQALAVAAEHLAFCPDNVWQGRPPYTLAGYAQRLVDAQSWSFWWD